MCKKIVICVVVVLCTVFVFESEQIVGSSIEVNCNLSNVIEIRFGYSVTPITYCLFTALQYFCEFVFANLAIFN